jgi:hypothetical protein
MSRKFISTVLAASIAVTGFFAAPARAGDDDVAKVIAGMAALFIIGSAIKKSRNDDNHGYNNHVSRGNRYEGDIQEAQPRRHTRPRPLPQRANRKKLPSECLRRFETRRGTVRMMAQRCLERNYRFTHALPQQCHTRVRTENGKRRGYAMRCLRDRGYSIARF